MPTALPARRQFLGVSAAGSLALFLTSSAASGATRERPLVVRTLSGPDAVLDATTIPRFVTPLVLPARMPLTGVVRSGGVATDVYDIAARQVQQQMLPAGMPSTTVFAYGPVTGHPAADLAATRFPSRTIDASYGRPVRIRWRNELLDEQGHARPHLLPVDPTLHWANPGGGVSGRDERPTFTSTPDPYTGPVPLVTHVHGATHVGDESDGYSESWYLPAAGDLSPDLATHGTWYEFFAAKARSRFGVVWEPGSAVHQYPNVDRACTNWFHDHALGLTRLNVYAGLAGLFVVRGGAQGDAAVVDRRTGAAAVLPSPAPRVEGEDPGRVHEVPLVIADRAFRPDGSLFYPGSRSDFDAAPGPYVPDTDLPPIWNPEFFGNTLTVNGSTWPVWSVGRRRYRVRVLNGCGARFLMLDFGAVPGVLVHRIGNDGGFLDGPVAVPAGEGMLLAPGERADLVVDFGAVPKGRYVVRNLGPDEPYGGGRPGEDFAPADPATTGAVLMVQVGGARVTDPSTPAARLRLPRVPALPAPTVVRRLAMAEMMSSSWDGPAMAMLGVVEGDPTTRAVRVTARMWGDAVTETPEPGVTELWEVYNTTEDAHPVHVHECKFEVVDRQPIDVREDPVDMAHTVQLTPGSTPRPPGREESGVKDTVVAYPGEVTRIRVRFGSSGQYVWHCHILEHEDNEMMRPFRIGPVQPGQPAGA